MAELVNLTNTPYSNAAILYLMGKPPHNPSNKYNAAFGPKCVTLANATFFVTFDDF